MSIPVSKTECSLASSIDNDSRRDTRSAISSSVTSPPEVGRPATNDEQRRLLTEDPSSEDSSSCDSSPSTDVSMSRYTECAKPTSLGTSCRSSPSAVLDTTSKDSLTNSAEASCFQVTSEKSSSDSSARYVFLSQSFLGVPPSSLAKKVNGVSSPKKVSRRTGVPAGRLSLGPVNILNMPLLSSSGNCSRTSSMVVG
ncbi:hypothetical protein CLU79DRAFT_770124, partial [Phycomyces nitens]